MTTINSTTAGVAATSAKSIQKEEQLSNSTKSKLAELGISSEGLTEAQAQSLIQQKEAEKTNTEQVGSTSESDILVDAKSLAAKLGVSVSSEDSVDDVLNNVATELEELLNKVESNPEAVQSVAEYFSELANLDSQYNNLQNSQNGIYSAMNMISTYKKLEHGL